MNAQRWYNDDCGMLKGRYVLALAASGIALFIAGAVVVGTSIGVHYGKVNCSKFGEQSNRNTRFVRYNYWTWDCLTPTQGGKWIPTSQLRDIQ